MTTGLTTDGWSAYDDAVPHTTGLPHVVERAATLRALRIPAAGASLTDVRDVVVVVSSSRGGSSLLGELLRRVPGLLHLRAEINPMFTLAGLHEGAERRRVLEDELLRDIGSPAEPGPLDDSERERLVLDIAWRLTVQWPDLASSVSLEDLLAIIDANVPPPGHRFDPVAVHLQVLHDLARQGASVHPGRYDLPPDLLERLEHCLPKPVGPPAGAVVEMPPFVTIDRWRPASATELRSMPLVLCTPRLSFRLELIRDLFPHADLRVVHLTRNPAASVNGLVDGWLHHGFVNCRVPGGLAIDGYSGKVCGGSEWWCYDFPPGWEDWTSKSLPEVCAFQWRATHDAAMRTCERLGIEPMRVRFEDVVGRPDDRLRVASTLSTTLGGDRQAVATALAADLPVVMSTARPAPGRWRRRETALRGVLSDPAVVELAAQLGYADDRTAWL